MTNRYITGDEFTEFKNRTNTLSTNAHLEGSIKVSKEFTGVITTDKINDLANAIYKLESEFSNNCCQSVNLNCCQTCQSSRCETCQAQCYHCNCCDYGSH